MDDSRGVNQEIEEISFQEDGKDQGSGQHSSRKASENSGTDRNRGTGRDSQVINQEEGEEGNNRRVGRKSESCYDVICAVYSTKGAVCRGIICGLWCAVIPAILAAIGVVLVILHGTDIFQENLSPERFAAAVGVYSGSGVASGASVVSFFVVLGILTSVCLYKRKERAASYNIGRQRAYVHGTPVGLRAMQGVGQSSLDEIPAERGQSFTNGQDAQVVEDSDLPEVVVHGSEEPTPPVLVRADMNKADREPAPKDQAMPGCSIELRDLKPTSPSVPVEYEESFTVAQST